MRLRFLPSEGVKGIKIAYVFNLLEEIFLFFVKYEKLIFAERAPSTCFITNVAINKINLHKKNQKMQEKILFSVVIFPEVC